MDVIVTFPLDRTTFVTAGLVAHGYACEEPSRLSAANDGPETRMVMCARSSHGGEALKTALDEFYRLSEGLWFDPTTMYLRLNDDDQGYIEYQSERSHHGYTVSGV